MSPGSGLAPDPEAEPPVRRVVLTGGPGAGKSAIQEVALKYFGDRFVRVPEAATILFGGGFPRSPERVPREAAQRAIYAVQRELEEITAALAPGRVLLCDRGTVDGAAYWPGPQEAFYWAVRSERARELARYEAVIHLEPPEAREGYNHKNPVRVESAEEAARIDRRIVEAWREHPHLYCIPRSASFLTKVDRALEILASVLGAGGFTQREPAPEL